MPYLTRLPVGVLLLSPILKTTGHHFVGRADSHSDGETPAFPLVKLSSVAYGGVHPAAVILVL